MTWSNSYEFFAGRRFSASSIARTVLCIGFITVIGVCAASVPAAAFKMEHPSSAIAEDGQDVTPPLIIKSPPTTTSDDSQCLALLKRIQHNGYSSDSMDRDRRAAGKAAAISLVFGVRFALGPREIRRNKSERPVRFEVWKAEDHSGAQAMAVADYRRCKNREALQAISNWRWER